MVTCRALKVEDFSVDTEMIFGTLGRGPDVSRIPVRVPVESSVVDARHLLAKSGSGRARCQLQQRDRQQKRKQPLRHDLRHDVFRIGKLVFTNLLNSFFYVWFCKMCKKVLSCWVCERLVGKSECEFLFLFSVF